MSIGYRHVLSGGDGNVKRIIFSVEENQTSIGQIVDSNATAFKILQDTGEFIINSFGVLAFVSAPDYEVQCSYEFKVFANSGTLYIATINVTDVASDFELLTETNLLLATQF